MKYCYSCGEAFTGDECPECNTTLHTLRPNSQTKKKEAQKKEESKNVNTK